MQKWQKALSFLGKSSISIFFIVSSINKIINWQNFETELIQTFSNWQSFTVFSEGLQKTFLFLSTWAPAFLLLLVLIELIGSLLVLFNVKIKIGTWMLIVFLFVTTILYKPFWFFHDVEQTNQMILFFQNFAVLGGLLYILVDSSKKNIKPLQLPTIKPLKKYI